MTQVICIINIRLSRLQKELEASKACPEEAKCKALRQQLREMQERCYHHQMRQQLNRQKNNVPSRPRDSGRQPGHYNPYTRQYVPAPRHSENSLAGMSSNSLELSGTSDRQKNDSNEREFQDNDVKLVDDEWLMTGEEGYHLDDDEWDMESLEQEIDDDDDVTAMDDDVTVMDDVTAMDDDWSSFDSPSFSTLSDSQPRTHDSQTLSTTSRSQSITAGKPGYQPPKTERSQSARQTPSFEQKTHGQSSKAGNVKRTVSSATTTSRRPNSRIPNKATFPSVLPITDSPEPGRIMKKRSGQSIFKAPGSKANNPT